MVAPGGNRYAPRWDSPVVGNAREARTPTAISPAVARQPPLSAAAPVESMVVHPRYCPGSSGSGRRGSGHQQRRGGLSSVPGGGGGTHDPPDTRHRRRLSRRDLPGSAAGRVAWAQRPGLGRSGSPRRRDLHPARRRSPGRTAVSAWRHRGGDAGVARPAAGTRHPGPTHGPGPTPEASPWRRAAPFHRRPSRDRPGSRPVRDCQPRRPGQPIGGGYRHRPGNAGAPRHPGPHRPDPHP